MCGWFNVYAPKKTSTESCCLLLAFPDFTSPRRECKPFSALFSKSMRQGLSQENVDTEMYMLLPGLGAVWAMGATCRVSTAPPPDQEVISIISSSQPLFCSTAPSTRGATSVFSGTRPAYRKWYPCHTPATALASAPSWGGCYSWS